MDEMDLKRLKKLRSITIRHSLDDLYSAEVVSDMSGGEYNVNAVILDKFLQEYGQVYGRLDRTLTDMAFYHCLETLNLNLKFDWEKPRAQEAASAMEESFVGRLRRCFPLIESSPILFNIDVVLWKEEG
ncbi:hypothetical protein CVT26_001829 [Gymnopilus dilepis]|uniref:Uncharacterized protein n=1 Tax=Gymnopilus dilepis TaxID=231916 RepID=A0A409VRS5_9AGAR|nr:hypothetical protein CVT26_001829 [Gymnopilus dilepis]